MVVGRLLAHLPHWEDPVGLVLDCLEVSPPALELASLLERMLVVLLWWIASAIVACGDCESLMIVSRSCGGAGCRLPFGVKGGGGMPHGGAGGSSDCDDVADIADRAADRSPCWIVSPCAEEAGDCGG